MVVQEKGSEYKDRSCYSGLSIDVKPTDCGDGSTFHEVDTGRVYMFDKKHDLWLGHGEDIWQPSTKEKPTNVAPGSTLHETDTGYVYLRTKDGQWERVT